MIKKDIFSPASEALLPLPREMPLDCSHPTPPPPNAGFKIYLSALKLIKGVVTMINPWDFEGFSEIRFFSLSKVFMLVKAPGPVC